MLMDSEQSNKGVDKIVQYKWIKHDEPGIVAMIPKGDLIIDDTYQREVLPSDMKVKRIASEWSWIACGAIIVADRDGDFYVVDGQHRVLAARKRSDVAVLPCVIFKTLGQKVEAEAFIRVNQNRKPMSSADAFKSMVVAENKTAMIIQELVAQSGRRVGKASSSATVQCVKAMAMCINADEDVMRRIWPVVVAIAKGKNLHVEILRGVFELERRIGDQTVTSGVFCDKMIRIGYDALLDAIGKAKGYRNASGPAIWAEGVLNAINHGQRSHKLVFAAK